jgi:hypothetical protein
MAFGVSAPHSAGKDFAEFRTTMEAATRIDTSGVNKLPGTAAATAPVMPTPAMDREFIIKNQIVERYLAGRLPPKGVTDFERLIRQRPELIEELGLADKVNAGLRLLDAAGVAEPWAEKQKKAWEKPAFGFGAAALAAVALIGCAVLAVQLSSRDSTIAKLKIENHERPIAPSTHKRTILVGTARNGPPSASSVSIGPGDFAEFKADLSWNRYGTFKVSIDRVNQGRVAVIDGIDKDSNGHVRMSLNAGAFGPGEYLVSIEALTLRREAIPVGWYVIAIEP